MTTELVELADRLDRAIDCAQSASRPIHNGGNTHLHETTDYIFKFAALRSEAAAIRALASGAGGLDVRFNPDGSLDEIIGDCSFHLEQMSPTHWWIQVGPHMVNLTAKGKISAHFGKNEAAPEPVGVG